MHELEPVSSFESRLRPGSSRGNIAVVLDRHPIVLEPKLSDKLVDSRRFCKSVKGAGLAVQQQGKWHDTSSLAVPFNP
jgi:hypothetical protein